MMRFLLTLILFMAYTSVAHAASGDVEAILKTPGFILTNGQKLIVKNFIEELKPGAVGSKITLINCRRDHTNADPAKKNDLYCLGRWLAVATHAKYIQLELQDKALDVAQDQDGVPAGSVRFYRKTPEIKVEGDAITKLEAVLSGLFTGTTKETLDQWMVERDKEDHTKYAGVCSYFDDINPATYTTLRKARFVMRAIRIIP